jgi:FKBP-type peptidyl-prolyl cis-trans isomerase FkpA
MNKWLLLILFVCCGVSGCIKSNSDLEQAKAQAAIDDKIIANYIAANNLTGKALKANDTTGVYYIVEQPGVGNDLFSSSTLVTLGFTGKLLTTQKVFIATDTTYHPAFQLGQVIIGWQLGIPKIKKGGIVRILIPSRDAYGAYAQPQIGLPANAVLDFEIQLYDIQN